MLKNLKMKLFNFLLRYVYNMTTLEDVLTIHYTDQSKGLGYIMVGSKPGPEGKRVGGKRMGEGEQRELVTHAKTLLALGGRKTIQKAIASDATEKLVLKSQTVDDMVAGKVMLYTLDVEEKLLEKIATLSQ